MISRWAQAGAAMVLFVSLTACGGMNNTGDGVNGDGVTTKGIGNNRVIDQNGNANGGNTNYSSMHNNTRMDLDEKIADAVTDLAEVESATVLLTDKNAYVAVMLDNGNRNDQNNNMTNINKLNTNGMNANGMNANGMNANGMNANGMNANRYNVNKKDLKTNGIGDHKLRSGFTGSNDGDNLTDDLTPELKNKIADTVKKQSQNVRNVYVSANPDFVGTMRGYGEQFSNGRPIRGAIIEFNRMVERVFPDNAEK